MGGGGLRRVRGGTGLVLRRDFFKFFFRIPKISILDKIIIISKGEKEKKAPLGASRLFCRDQIRAALTRGKKCRTRLYKRHLYGFESIRSTTKWPGRSAQACRHLSGTLERN